ncbi:MAG: cadmium-translocating P-type ATPase [Pseudomonadota bacterium]|jgi:Cu2+-exporting ATPase
MATAVTENWLLEGHWASESHGEGHAVFNAEGIHCARCARAIHQALDTLPGMVKTEVNVVNGRVSVSWRPQELSLSRILRQVAEAGFRPVPLVGEAAVTAQREERRTAQKRIGLAALGSMQLMMYAAGLYAGAFQGIDPVMAEVLRVTCLIIATPVLFYSGTPILRGAIGDLRRRVLGMDVTVSLALVLAYLASVYNTITGIGDVYLDSVTMFILFLLLGRYVEMRGRHQTTQLTEALARSLPSSAQRIDPITQATSRISLDAISVDDWLRVGSGQILPVDGEVAVGEALVDESLVTGESLPHRRLVGEQLLGGSLNAGAAITLKVTRRPQDSTLYGLVRLLERAQSERPRLSLAAERMASWFVVRVLLLTALVGVIWYVVDPSRAFPAVLAVLVATCPCALSIATPVAIAAATTRLARLGVLVTKSDAVEGLATLDTVMLDKTGTLTAGKPGITTVEITSGDLSRERALNIAAALEAQSQHPIAAAFKTFFDPRVVCTDAHEMAGEGIQGTVDGERWRIGQPGITLSNDSGVRVSFTIADPIRDDAIETIAALQKLNLRVLLASGDTAETVKRVAAELGIPSAAAELKPQQKLELLRAEQAAGHRVLMVGDGINDGPVLAAADVSMAMGRGSAIAHAAGDLLLLRESLASLSLSIGVARRSLRIIRQNLAWAAFYNIAAIPIAALGFMPPWIAALGMSLSSLLVVFNARRILRPAKEEG